MKIVSGSFLTIIFIATFSFFSCSVFAHVCSDVTPGGAQYEEGCEPVIITQPGGVSQNGNVVSFTINVENRQTPYPPASSCGNPWSGTLTSVYVYLDTCDPSCDLVGCPDCTFDVDITPSSQDIPINTDQDYDIDITVYNANGEYNLTFNVDASQIVVERIYLMEINVSGSPPSGTGGDNSQCSSCSSQSCDTVEATCESVCSGATYCTGTGCDFDTSASGSAESCCGDDSGENFIACSKESGIYWGCPTQDACCEYGTSCVYSGNCYSNNNVHQVATGEDAYAYCSSNQWHDCDEGSTTCSNCGFYWINSECCEDDSGENYRTRICSSGCSSDSGDEACCSDDTMCVYSGTCYASSSRLCVSSRILNCNSGTWETYDDCTTKASTETDSGCSDYSTAGTVRDYTSCSGTQCTYTEYTDSCSGTMLTEYCVDGSGYTSSQYNCSSGNGCFSGSYRVYSCSIGRCTYTNNDPDDDQSYCEGCGFDWSENTCCGDDSSEYYADLCPGVSGVSRKCCSSSSHMINSLGQCTTDCDTSGMGGDNSQCSSCSSQSCDTVEATCESVCSGATYCTGTGCDFDTSASGSAESCCGDDSGENFIACSKESGIYWGCPTQDACCQQSDSCVYSGNCYSNNNVHQVATGEDAYAYCSSNQWHDCDEGSTTCSNCGFYWINSECCGDDSGEYNITMFCSSGCSTNSGDRACCDSDDDCVYSGVCYSDGEQRTIGSTEVNCTNGEWVEETEEDPDEYQQTCETSACNLLDRCQSCPGCAYKDYSCVDTTCTPEYIDPDSSQSYCDLCELTWSNEGEQKNCCGDDNNEYWITPCPNATGVSNKCCNNPNDRVDENGSCVSSCGLQITANVTKVEEEYVPMAVSFLPDLIEIEPGDTIEFKVFIRTEWNRSLHNVSISFCKEFEFEIDPPVIDEVRPNEIVSFNVKMHAPENSTIGTRDFEVYVGADEFLNDKMESGVLKIGEVDYTIYFIYAGIIIAIVSVILLRKFMIHKEKRGFGKPSQKPSKPVQMPAQPLQPVDRGLVDYIRKGFQRGLSENYMKQTLLLKGWKKWDVERAFKEAKK